MNMENAVLIVERPHKKVYKCEKNIVKVFHPEHPKADVFNEALNTARVEATGLDIPKVKEVAQVDGKWALFIEYKEGKTLEQMMEENPGSLEGYMERFVDLQLEVHGKRSPLLNKLKDKLSRQINGLKEIDATTRYELLTRLESMPKHDKLCHGDFNPSNVIVGEDGQMTVVDWAHATQGNASADAANGHACKPGKAKVTQVYRPGQSKHPYHLVAVAGGGSNVYGWVDAADVSGKASSAATRTYTVRSGDSLWAIAAKQLGNGSRYKEIKSLNGLSSDTIHPGQVLKLPE